MSCRGLLIAVTALAGGCVLAPPAPEPGAPATLPEALPEPSAAEPPPAPPAPAPPVRDAVPQPSAADAELERKRILVVRSSDIADLQAVAEALDAVLGARYELEHVSLSAAPDIGHGAADLAGAVAIGLEAAAFAARELSVPIVFCQVFGYEPLLALPAALYGVAALPPLDMQLASWMELAPQARAIGLIIGPEHADLVAEARRAAEAAGVELNAELATSDREALYRFKRLVPEIDGIWLFPDNDILSPRVIRELLAYALKHRVHTIVFSPALLEWGALLSVTSRAPDVAETVAAVLDELGNGSGHSVPPITPLTQIEVRVNEHAAAALGLVPAAALSRAE